MAAAASQKGLSALANLADMQTQESNRPQLSQVSWLPDVLRIRGSIIPSVLGPVCMVTLWAAAVAIAQRLYGGDLQLTNSVVPLLSVMVGLLLVFRNSSAYERYAEGRKDFTQMISNARNLSRNIWLYTSLPAAQAPPADQTADKRKITARELTAAKERLVRMVVGLVVATKHHLRAEGGMHHRDLQGLLPPDLQRYDLPGFCDSDTDSDSPAATAASARAIHSASGSVPIRRTASQSSVGLGEEERLLGSPSMAIGRTGTRPRLLSIASAISSYSNGDSTGTAGQARAKKTKESRKGLRRRPTAVRVHSAARSAPQSPASASAPRFNIIASTPENLLPQSLRPIGGQPMDSLPTGAAERSPLLIRGIKAGIVPDERRDAPPKTAMPTEAESIKVVELGLPLIIAHEIGRSLYKLRRLGCLDAVGPAGYNAMQLLLQSMTDQLGNMERIVQTPLPFIFAVHLKQCVTIYLFTLPFTLVDIMGWRMVPLVAVVAFTLMGVEGIASEVEQPFGDDPNDLNLDLYCAELRCEIEYILERLPEGDEETQDDFLTSSGFQHKGRNGPRDDGADGDDDDGDH